MYIYNIRDSVLVTCRLSKFDVRPVGYVVWHACNDGDISVKKYTVYGISNANVQEPQTRGRHRLRGTTIFSVTKGPYKQISFSRALVGSLG